MSFESFSLAVMLPETKGKMSARQSLIDYAKTFISSIDRVRDSNITITKRQIIVEDESFGVFLNSAKFFKMGITIENEKVLGTMNAIINQIFEKFNEINMDAAKSDIILIYHLTHKFAGAQKPFSRILRNEVLEEISQAGIRFIPLGVKAWTGRRGKKKRGIQFEINTIGKNIVLEVNLLNLYKGRFPIDITEKALKDSKGFLNKLLTVLVGDQR